MRLRELLVTDVACPSLHLGPIVTLGARVTLPVLVFDVTPHLG